MKDEKIEHCKKYAPVVLRIGMSLVFLWFGISQLIDPTNYIGYLPEFLFNSSFAHSFVIGNGIFEIIAGLLLLLGFFVRPIALLLALHLAVITFELGYGEVAVRDFGLTLATLSIALGGNDIWCLSTRFKKK